MLPVPPADPEQQRRVQEELAARQREAEEQPGRPLDECEREELEAIYQWYLALAQMPQESRTQWRVLTIAQACSILACVAIAVTTLVQLVVVIDSFDRRGGAPVGWYCLLIALTGGVSFIWAVALSIVFSRVKWVPRLAEWQRAVMYKLEEVINNSKHGPSAAERACANPTANDGTAKSATTNESGQGHIQE